MSIRFDERMTETPGFIVYVLKELAWHNINVVEVVSTYTELIIVLEEKDLLKSYKVINDLLFGEKVVGVINPISFLPTSLYLGPINTNLLLSLWQFFLIYQLFL